MRALMGLEGPWHSVESIGKLRQLSKCLQHLAVA